MKWLLVSSLMISFCGMAQSWVDLANVYTRFSPNNEIDSTTETRNFTMFSADLLLPVVLNEKDVLITGLAYQFNKINSISTFDFTKNLPSFYSTELKFGWERKWSTQFKTLSLIIPRLNSDFQNLEFSQIQLGGLFLLTKTRSDQFSWHTGVYYNGELFGPMIVPLYGFNWSINEKWRFKLTIPVTLDISYRPTNKQGYGLRFDGVNASYWTQINGSNTKYYIDKADNNLWAFAEFMTVKNCFIQLRAGHSVLRKYRVYEKGDRLNLKLGPVNIGDERAYDHPLFNNGWSLEARFIYRLPLN